jgi:hypothetical protein
MACLAKPESSLGKLRHLPFAFVLDVVRTSHTAISKVIRSL